MNRRFLLASALGLALSGMGAVSPASAQDRTDDVLRTLRAQGYDEIGVSRTWLGRTRITATGRPGRREIVLNPNTGEILRDFWEAGSSGSLTDDSPDDDVEDSDDDGADDDGDDSGSDDSGSDDGGDDGAGDDGGGDEGGGNEGGGDD